MDLLAKIRNIRENHEKDGILSWAICVSALVANAIVVGIDSSFGEALPSIVIEFNSTESKVAWIGSLHSSAQNFSAFFSSVLAKIFGFGPTISFGILISSAFLACRQHRIMCLSLPFTMDFWVVWVSVWCILPLISFVVSILLKTGH